MTKLSRKDSGFSVFALNSGATEILDKDLNGQVGNSEELWMESAGLNESNRVMAMNLSCKLLCL